MLQINSFTQPIIPLSYEKSMGDFQLIDSNKEFSKFSKKIVIDQNNYWSSEVVIDGMYCIGCAIKIENTLKAVIGIKDARVFLNTNRAKVVWQEKKTMPSKWMEVILRIGYQVVPAYDYAIRESRKEMHKLEMWKLLVAGFCMMQVMMYSVPEYFSQSIEITVPIKNLLHWASWVLTLPVIIFSCWHFMIKAFKNIILYQIGMDTPVSIGVLITFIVSTYATFDPDGILGSAVYFDSLTMFVFFILIGRYFELRLKEKTIGALDALINVLPSTVQRLLNSNSQQVEMIAIDVIKIGDKIRILPGECFPVDAILLDKMTHVEESLLTGESSAVEKHVGDKLLAGSYNLSNPVWVKVTQIEENTEFSKIVSLMESANATKPRVAIIADQIAKPFIVFIFIAAIFAGLFNIDQGASYALMIAASVLVVTCPCALSLATPAAIISAVSRLAKSGVLVKKFQAIENLSLIDVVIFDKTGTLSNDELHLDKIFTKFGVFAFKTELSIEVNEILKVMTSLANLSLHPLSVALKKIQIDKIKIINPIEYPGKGMEGEYKVQGSIKKFRLGSLAFCEELVGKFEISRNTIDCVIHFCDENEWIASISVYENIREDANAVINQLSQLGLKVMILSGDIESKVHDFSKLLNVPVVNVKGICSPLDKLFQVRSLQKEGNKVLMIGDGFNDMPVLAGSDVSISFGKSIAVARSLSDLVIMGGKLQPIVDLIKLSRKTMKIIKINLIWAAAYNAICIPLAIFGLMPAWLAGLGMATSSLIVLLNSHRLIYLSVNN